MTNGVTMEFFYDWSTNIFYIVNYTIKTVLVIDSSSVYHTLLMQFPTYNWRGRNLVVDTYDFTKEVIKLNRQF